MTIDEIRIRMAEADNRVEKYRANINEILLYPLLKKACAVVEAVEEKQRLLRCKKAREDWKIYYRTIRIERRIGRMCYGSEQQLFCGLTVTELADKLF